MNYIYPQETQPLYILLSQLYTSFRSCSPPIPFHSQLFFLLTVDHIAYILDASSQSSLARALKPEPRCEPVNDLIHFSGNSIVTKSAHPKTLYIISMF